MVKLTDLNIGDTLISKGNDDITDGTPCVVHEDDSGSLWVFSRDDHHYLDLDTDLQGNLKTFTLLKKAEKDPLNE